MDKRPPNEGQGKQQQASEGSFIEESHAPWGGFDRDLPNYNAMDVVRDVNARMRTPVIPYNKSLIRIGLEYMVDNRHRVELAIWKLPGTRITNETKAIGTAGTEFLGRFVEWILKEKEK